MKKRITILCGAIFVLCLQGAAVAQPRGSDSSSIFPSGNLGGNYVRPLSPQGAMCQPVGPIPATVQVEPCPYRKLDSTDVSKRQRSVSCQNNQWVVTPWSEWDHSQCYTPPVRHCTYTSGSYRGITFGPYTDRNLVCTRNAECNTGQFVNLPHPSTGQIVPVYYGSGICPSDGAIPTPPPTTGPQPVTIYACIQDRALTGFSKVQTCDRELVQHIGPFGAKLNLWEVLTRFPEAQAPGKHAILCGTGLPFSMITLTTNCPSDGGEGGIGKGSVYEYSLNQIRFEGSPMSGPIRR